MQSVASPSSLGWEGSTRRETTLGLEAASFLTFDLVEIVYDGIHCSAVLLRGTQRSSIGFVACRPGRFFVEAVPCSAVQWRTHFFPLPSGLHCPPLTLYT